MPSLVIHNATIINEGSQFEGSLLIEGNRIASLHRGKTLFSELPIPFQQAANKIDAEGLWLLPGAIDDQVHFREPGLTHKGTIASESRAAVAGGVTSFLEMPNTKPTTTDYVALMWKRERAAASAWANYGFYLGGTNSNAQQLFEIDPTLYAGIKLFLGSSTGNMLVDSPKALDEFFAESPKIIAIHSESEPIIAANREHFQKIYGEDPPLATHPLIRSDEACYRCTYEAMERATKYRTNLHILHLSTAREVALLKSDLPFPEKHITAEACIHHLWFSDQDYEKKGSLIKWNPAIKQASDRQALREAVQNNTIDIIATDHAPHLLKEKEGGAVKAASGGPLLQHALIALLELVKQGVFTLDTVVEKFCHNPARRFSIQGRGFIREGYYADLVLVNPSKGTLVERDDSLLSHCGWSPFEGETFSTAIDTTIVNGQVAFHQGELYERPPIEALQFEK